MARSRLYRSRFLQVNFRWKALDEIYKIYMLLHRSDLNISAKLCQTSSHFSAIFFGRMRLKKHSEKTEDARPKREQRRRERASSGTRKSAALSRLVAKRLLARLARARKFCSLFEFIFVTDTEPSHHDKQGLFSHSSYSDSLSAKELVLM